MQRLMGGWAGLGGLCACFCFYAGVRYLMLPEQMRFYYGVDLGLRMLTETSGVAFWTALNLSSVVFVLWSIVWRRRLVLPALAMLLCSWLGTWILAIVIDRPVPVL